MKNKISIISISVALLAASTLCVASGEVSPNNGATVSTASFQRELPVKATLSAVPSQYASRMNTSGLMEGVQYDRFIVYYRTYTGLRNTTDSTAAANNARVSSVRKIAIEEKRTIATGGRVVQATKAMNAADAQAFMLEYAKSAEVEFIEPDVIVQPNGWFEDWEALVPYLGMSPMQPNDPGYSKQWALATFNPRGVDSNYSIDVLGPWNLATGRGVVVAVVDGGITAHSEFEGRVLPGYNFHEGSADASDPGDWLQEGDRRCLWPQKAHPSTWHGTHVAGIIAAKANNGIGVAGVAFNSKILPVRVLGPCGGYLSSIVEGIVWAAGGSAWGAPANPNPAKVINLSLGVVGACSNSFQQAIDIARDNGATVVVAAGNDRQNASNEQPANCQGVITVGASTKTGDKANFSNFGPLISVMAPGVDIYSTVNSGATVPVSESYGSMSGTSMAAPHVSGVVALLLEQQPGLTPDQVKKYIVPTAIPMTTATCLNLGCGSGLINAWNVLTMPLSGRAITIQPGQPVPNLSGSRGDSVETWYEVTLPAGTSTFTFTTTGGTGYPLLYVTTDVSNQRNYGLSSDGSKYSCSGERTCQHSFTPLTKPEKWPRGIGQTVK